MGVVVLQSYPVPHDKSAAQVIEVIQKRIANLGAHHRGQLLQCFTLENDAQNNLWHFYRQSREWKTWL